MLFNDRYGMHRLYYHESKEAFYFAVEAKAILEVCPDLRRADPRGLGEFVACGCVLENRTLFEGIYVLPRCVSLDLSSRLRRAQKQHTSSHENGSNKILWIRNRITRISEKSSRRTFPATLTGENGSGCL